MPVTIHIEAETAEEAQRQMRALVWMHGVPALPSRGPMPAGTPPEIALRGANALPAEPSPEKPRRGRKPKAPPSQDMSGDEENRPDRADPLADAGDEPSAPEPQPEPAKESEEQKKALVLLQRAYGRPGGAALVKELQRKYGVARFAEVPADMHAELLADATELSKKVA